MATTLALLATLCVITLGAFAQYSTSETARMSPVYLDISHDSDEYTSIKCYGKDIPDRLCYVKNFCFDHNTEHFLFFVDSERRHKLWQKHFKHNDFAVESSVDWLYPAAKTIVVEKYPSEEEIEQDEQSSQSSWPAVRWHDDLSLIYRSHINEWNLYHYIHDDVLPLFHTLSFWHPEIEDYYGAAEDQQYPIDPRVKIFILDPYSHKHSNEFVRMLSDNVFGAGRAEHRSRAEYGRERTCFRRGLVGLSRLPRTYSAGFHEPPAPYPFQNGIWQNMAVDYMLTKMGIEPVIFSNVHPTPVVLPSVEANEQVVSNEVRAYLNSWRHLPLCSPEHQCIVSYMVRKRTRTIMNRDMLVGAIEKLDSVSTVHLLDEGSMDITHIINTIRHSDILIGPHGAGLTAGLFLPVGGSVIELAAFGSNTKVLGYFRHMFGSVDSGKQYRYWKNPDAMKSRAPLWAQLYGKSKEEVFQCMKLPPKYEPYQWGSACVLYFKNHDTIADVSSIVDIISNVTISTLPRSTQESTPHDIE